MNTITSDFDRPQEYTEAYNMDCMAYMAGLPDKAFELATVDPPYGIGIGTMNYTKSGAVHTPGRSAAKRRDYRNKGDWDLERPKPEYFKELFRISVHQIIWGGNYFADLLPPSKSFVVWDKRVSNNMSNDFADCEYAWCSCGVARMFRHVWNGMIQGDMKNKEARIHPTQKPVALYEWLLTRYAKPGDRILDTHLGSGSSRIAAYNLGFDFVGCEIDPGCFEAQEARFAAHTAQASLFV
jgi:site-specific DNA-methyltransferase (adenine-specific)